MLMDIALFIAGFIAGTFGALLGIGGGVIVVPFLVLFVKVPIRIAIGTSFIAVLSTSLTAASAYLTKGLCDIETGIRLETATVTGAAMGAYIAGAVNPRVLQTAFSILLFYVSITMIRKKRAHREETAFQRSLTRNRGPVADAASFLAGIISGSLGVGGGLIKVPILHRLLNFPMTKAIATSSYMIGITVATSTLVFTFRGDVNPYIAAPLVAGIFLGASQGARFMPRIPEKGLKVTFSLLLLYFAVRFLIMGVG
jgi:uncharacterized membrane protein YfcA